MPPQEHPDRRLNISEVTLFVVENMVYLGPIGMLSIRRDRRAVG
jgi:hypothetical protein